MKVGIGYKNSSDARSTGVAIAEAAMKNGNIQKPDMVLSFCHGSMDHFEFFKGLQSVVGNQVPIIGGSAVGIITSDHLSYEGCPAGAAILSSSDILFKWAGSDGLDIDEVQAGRSLGEKIYTGPDDNLFLLFYDSIKTPPTEISPPVMNASPLITRGVEETLQSTVPIIGAGVLGGFDFGPTHQFCGDHVGRQSVTGVMMSGDVFAYHCVTHGCTPLDGVYHEITKSRGSNIYELDGRPVVSVIDEIYGNQEWQKQTPLKRLAIGVNHGDPYAPFKEKNYVNRLITGVLPDMEGIVIFEPDLAAGSKIQFMLRDSREMILSAQKNTEHLMAQIKAEGRQPLFGLYIDCAGRTSAFSETLTEEALEVVKTLNHYKTPFLGFYSGVEVAPMFGTSRGLDWTGVLVVMAR